MIHFEDLFARAMALKTILFYVGNHNPGSLAALSVFLKMTGITDPDCGQNEAAGKEERGIPLSGRELSARRRCFNESFANGDSTEVT